MTQFYCVIPYLSDQGSLSISLRKLTLDLHPKIQNSKHETGHTNISLASTHEKCHEALTILVEELIDMPLHRFIQSPQAVQHIMGSTFPSYQISSHPSLVTLSKINYPRPQIPMVVDNSLYTSSINLQKLVISS